MVSIASIAERASAKPASREILRRASYVTGTTVAADGGRRAI
jgi:NAD(P)-dependent dehydrogenase (short-subunit alcohol dehydrogenase family)